MQESDDGYVDPVVEAYKKDLDLTLIRENLKLTVEERFRKAMALQRFAEELKRAGEAATPKHRPTVCPKCGFKMDSIPGSGQ